MALQLTLLGEQDEAQENQSRHLQSEDRTQQQKDYVELSVNSIELSVEPRSGGYALLDPARIRRCLCGPQRDAFPSIPALLRLVLECPRN